VNPIATSCVDVFNVAIKKERTMSIRRIVPWLMAVAIGAGSVLAQAQADKSPDALIKDVSTDVLNSARADKSIKQGDISKMIALVDTKVMPYVDFQRMTASAVGRYWRQATPAQQKSLEDAFKILLVRTYSGALSQVQDQTVDVKPMRSAPTDKEVVVRTEVKGRGDPVQLDYRLEQTPVGWKIYDVNVLGVWLVENYRNSFSDQIGAGGIDGLITKLQERNKANGN
jgi:phospholipid transport system substrate-binding protein